MDGFTFYTYKHNFNPVEPNHVSWPNGKINTKMCSLAGAASSWRRPDPPLPGILKCSGNKYLQNQVQIISDVSFKFRVLKKKKKKKHRGGELHVRLIVLFGDLGIAWPKMIKKMNKKPNPSRKFPLHSMALGSSCYKKEGAFERKFIFFLWNHLFLLYCWLLLFPESNFANWTKE